ncbi:leucine-rich PPR motif-containing protein, mitochondrial-like isoform X2 [Chelonus insularis]|uniref:leucine-rich PPR motif-containing protein, mitochondrial-like isoform X2 n=1 Tax=Chelonus insularis TaxID=460826 RepID=UPI00158E7176|nr:leucine-rich PPR motif-containing protein, mitochondrial-like isoform X2 [Chelonus insularis]
MLSVRLCTRLAKAFPTRSVTCQAQFIQRFVHNVKRRGYPRFIVHIQRQQIHYKNDVNNNNTFNSNNNYYYNRRQNIRRVNELLSYIEFLKINLKNSIVDHAILLEALKIFAALNVKVDDSINIFLLSCCGEILPNVKPEVRQKLLYDVWNSLKEKHYTFSFDYYHTFLNVCAQNCEDIKPQEFIENMTLQPNKDTYIQLLNVSASSGNLNSTVFILKKLKELEYSLNLDVINLLIKFYSKINDMASARFALNSVIDSHTEVPNELFGSLACGYAQQGDVDHVIELLEQHSISTKQLLQIMKNLSLANKGETIENIFKYIPVKEMLTDPLLINFIIELTYLHKIDDCLLILNFFSTKGFTHDILHASKYFLKTLASSETYVPTILSISNKFSENFGFTTVALSLLQGALISNKTDLSFILLEKMAKNNVEIRPHYYWPLLIQIFKQKGEPGIYEVIDHSVQMEVKLDWTTLSDYIIPYISIWDPMETLRKLTNHGVHEYIVVTPLIKYYLEHEQIPNASILCQKMYRMTDFNEILPSLVQAYRINKKAIDVIVQILLLPDKTKDYPGKFLFQAVSQRLFHKNIEEFEKLLNIYKANNISISSFSANAIENYAFSADVEKIKILFKAANIINNEDKSPVSNAERISGMVHPQHMNQEQLDCHLTELKSKGLNFRGALRKFFLTCAKNGDLKKLEEIKMEMEKYGMQLTPGMKSCLLELYARNEKAIEAYYLILDLKKDHPDWTLDSSKILITATSLLNHKEVEKALKLIKETEVVSFPMQRQCWKLLDVATQLKKPQLVELLLNNLVKKGFCSIDNTVLGPLVRVHLLRNDLTSAVETFKIKLQGKHIHFKRIVGGMEEKVKQKVLLTLLDAARDIHGINRPLICDLLFASYSNTTSIHDALELWQKMKDEGITISNNIETKYSKILDSYQKIISHTTENK